MIFETHEVSLYFDPVTDVCVGATDPSGEQYWLAGSNQSHAVSGKYRLSFVANKACNQCDALYRFLVYPLGKTAEEINKLKE